MELVCRKYHNLDCVKKQLLSQGDQLIDLICAIEIGFIEQENTKKTLHSHTFCYHYCIDKYDNNKNISFLILDANDQTGQYCFWDYEKSNYSPRSKSKKFQIESSKISVKFENVEISKDIDFKEFIKNTKEDLLNLHLNNLDFFKKNQICYDSHMDLFTKELKAYIDFSYEDLFNLELAPKIKQYQAQLLNDKLTEKQDFFKKTIKI